VRPDRATTKGERQLTIYARSVDARFVSAMEDFLDAYRSIAREIGRPMRDRPIEFLHVGGEGVTVEEW
jgi:hypothetical protein